jgi:hypothetical protein
MHFLPVPVYNFSPIGAIALFGGAYLGGRHWSLLAPFAALFLSDLILNNLLYAQYYEGFAWFTSIWTYLAFAAVVAIGYVLLHKQRTPLRLLAGSLSASALFFLITNTSVWLESGIYTPNAAGLSAALAAGIPFVQNTILGDLFFSIILFGVYEGVQQRAVARV